ncbi:hypothetical protein DM860_006646 [Cuscuta australis]|uniref:Spen paralogue and orthologue SPOC C-terminal domain-containing protein n=1 Tax=Cuscuta australis TaxID=267555 RepID=A0A328D4V3_9ASTE|nr:hypothetical protein DM860_006646 [Cuscuta australis]
MAEPEQPLKKRKVGENITESSPPVPLLSRPLFPPPPPPPLEAVQPPPPPTPPQISHEEVLLRRRNQEEIRNVYGCFNRINFCIAQKDKRLQPDIERAYLSLITASRGCSSVQRLAAEFIPKYASHCPTALEAAVKVLINMHNWSFAVVSRVEDADGIAFDIVKACIFGLADICQSAATAALLSSVIQGVSTTVFRDALTFLISSFEGTNIFQIVDKEFLKTDDILGSLTQYQKNVVALDDSRLLKLMKFRALSLLRIFFTCTRNVISTCYDLFDSAETHKEGNYFLRQLIERFDVPSSRPLTVECNGSMQSISKNTSYSGDDCIHNGFATESKNTLKHTKAVPKICLLALVLNNNISLKKWIISRHKKLCKSGFSQVVSAITSILEEVFDSSLDQIKIDDIIEESEDDFRSREHNNQCFIPRACSQGHTTEVSRSSMVSQLTDRHLNTDNLGSRSMTIDSKEQGDLVYNRSSISGELSNQQVSSPVIRPLYSRSFSIDGGTCSSPTERSLTPSMDHHLPALRTCGGAVCSTPSPKKPFPLNHSSGFGTRGTINGVAQGSSSHVYIGNVQNQWAKDDIIHEARKIVYNGPVTVTDIYSEAALLMEFETPEEASMVMNHLRQCRNANNCFIWPPNAGPLNATMHAEGSRLASTFSPCRMAVSSHVHTMIEQQTNVQLTSKPGVHHVPSFAKPDNGFMEHTSPRIKPEHGAMTSSEHPGFQPQWRPFVGQDMHEVREVDKIAADPFNQGGGISGSGDQMWAYRKPERELHSGPGGISCIPTPTQGLAMGPSIFSQGPPVAPPQPLQTPLAAPPHLVQASPFAHHQVPFGPLLAPAHPIHTHIVQSPQPTQRPTISPSQPVQTPFIQPGYFPPSSWDTHLLNHSLPPIPSPSSVMPTSIHHNARVPPYLPAAVTPLAQFHANSIPPYNHTLYMNNRPPSASFPPPSTEFRHPFTNQPGVQLPLSSSPPHPGPQIVPPPPNSPPPPPPSESLNSENLKQCPQNQWQGSLNKSGIHYCKVYAQRVESVVCKYSSAVAEPTEWPAKLDMTKRTDFQHVKSTFSSTPPNKREICWLLPASQDDHKGFQDFISYLKQRECAGVIKMPAVKSMWARILFILPQCPEIWSMLSLEPNPGPCLIGLVLPKETNFEWV